MSRFGRCDKSMARVQIFNYSDYNRVRRIPSLLRGSVEKCNFQIYSYCIIVVIPLEYFNIVFDHVKNPQRMNAFPHVKLAQKNCEETLNKHYLMLPLRIHPWKLESLIP